MDALVDPFCAGSRRRTTARLLPRLRLRLRGVQRRHRRPGAIRHQGAFLEYGYVDQDRNWSGTSSAPSADNDDKQLATAFYTAGAQFSLGPDWNLGFAIPYLDRSLTSADAGPVQTVHHDGLGDVRVSAKYTGFSADRSSGIEAGMKLPTGAHDTPGFDRDTDFGTGTTDLLLGAYHLANFGSDAQWTGFARAQFSYALAGRAGYRPGNEMDAIFGLSYAGWTFGRRSTLAPVLELIAVDRGRDSGAQAMSEDTGYSKLLLAPGLEWDRGNFKLYADVEFALYQDVVGNQLVAERQYKATLSYQF